MYKSTQRSKTMQRQFAIDGPVPEESDPSHGGHFGFLQFPSAIQEGCPPKNKKQPQGRFSKRKLLHLLVNNELTSRVPGLYILFGNTLLVVHQKFGFVLANPLDRKGGTDSQTETNGNPKPPGPFGSILVAPSHPVP